MSNSHQSLLLFDLNGVLVEESQAAKRKKGPRVSFKPRPGFAQGLLALSQRFRLGVYSSATHATVKKALGALRAEVVAYAAGTPDGMPAGIGSGAHGLLSIVFHRKHCVPDPNWQTREGGKRWSTIKPLAVHGLELTRTLLIDNEAYKAAAGEGANMVVIPNWQNAADGGMAEWQVLVKALLEMPTTTLLDVRAYTASITARLQQAHVPGKYGNTAVAGRQPASAPVAALQNGIAPADVSVGGAQKPAKKRKKQKVEEALEAQDATKSTPNEAAIVGLVAAAGKVAQQLLARLSLTPDSITTACSSADGSGGGSTENADGIASAASTAAAAVVGSQLEVQDIAAPAPSHALLLAALAAVHQKAETDPNTKLRHCRDVYHYLGSEGSRSGEMDLHVERVVLCCVLLAKHQVQGTLPVSRAISALTVAVNKVKPSTVGKCSSQLANAAIKAVVAAGEADKFKRDGVLRLRLKGRPPMDRHQALAQLFVLDLELKATLQRTPASSKEQFALTSMPQAMPAATKASSKDAVNTTAAAMALGSKSAAAAASPHELMQEAQAAVHGTVFAENADRLHLLLGRLALALAGEQLQELEAGTGGVLVDDVVLLSKKLQRDIARHLVPLCMVGQGGLPDSWPADSVIRQRLGMGPVPTQGKEGKAVPCQGLVFAAERAGCTHQGGKHKGHLFLPGEVALLPSLVDCAASFHALATYNGLLVGKASTSEDLETCAAPQVGPEHSYGVQPMDLPAVGHTDGSGVSAAGLLDEDAAAGMEEAEAAANATGRPAKAARTACHQTDVTAVLHAPLQGLKQQQDAPREQGQRTQQQVIGEASTAEVAASTVAAAPPQQQQQQQPAKFAPQTPQAATSAATQAGAATSAVTAAAARSAGAGPGPSSLASQAAAGGRGTQGTKRRHPVLPGAEPMYNGTKGWLRESLAADGAHADVAAHGHRPRDAPPLSRLHGEVLRFASAAAPTQDELGVLARALRCVEKAARRVWHQKANTVLFGSQAAGLALPNSDLDIVVLGVSSNLTRPAQGFGKPQQAAMVRELQRLVQGLRQAGVLLWHCVIPAKVPIIKAKISVPASNFPANTPAIIHPPSKPYSFSGQRPQPQLAPGHVCVDVDISLGTVNGADAVALVRRCVEAVAPVRPLVLVLKALLRQAGLNEVFTGGLSSYSLINMVLAHLQCEGYDVASVLQGTGADRYYLQQQAGGSSTGAGRGTVGSPGVTFQSGPPFAPFEEEPPEDLDLDKYEIQGLNLDLHGDDDGMGGGSDEDGMFHGGEDGEESEETDTNSDSTEDEDEVAAEDEELLEQLLLQEEGGADQDAAADAMVAPPQESAGPVTGAHGTNASGLHSGNGTAAAGIAAAGGNAGGGDGDGEPAVCFGLPPGSGLCSEQLRYLSSLAGQQVAGVDLGLMLKALLHRYGLVLDPCHEAVSVLQGGIVAKQPGWRLAAKPWLLAVEDPQQAGRDIAQGSYNIRNVLGTLADTLHTLQEAEQELESVRDMAGHLEEQQQQRAGQYSQLAAAQQPLAAADEVAVLLPYVLDLPSALARTEYVPKQCISGKQHVNAPRQAKHQSQHRSQPQQQGQGQGPKEWASMPSWLAQGLNDDDEPTAGHQQAPNLNSKSHSGVRVAPNGPVPLHQLAQLLVPGKTASRALQQALSFMDPSRDAERLPMMKQLIGLVHKLEDQHRKQGNGLHLTEPMRALLEQMYIKGGPLPQLLPQKPKLTKREKKFAELNTPHSRRASGGMLSPSPRKTKPKSPAKAFTPVANTMGKKRQPHNKISKKAKAVQRAFQSGGGGAAWAAEEAWAEGASGGSGGGGGGGGQKRKFKGGGGSNKKSRGGWEGA